ncbi:MAG: hypothetical protein A2Y17_08185 [Clostridiales bacterium GWF2_38_85]|nr:MAG: hypothetical protein A2Y17_08185 [Clostridiales bacterium GWF2_38_85]HBL83829.1 FeoB-associated Cys-rich membrane protein [Clostridiales bacterium]
MLTWFAENAATLAISAVLIVLAVFAIKKMIDSKKKGGCAGGCSHCVYGDQCSSNPDNKPQ